jgi:7-carboxy-7-deazaguanine synthase
VTTPATMEPGADHLKINEIFHSVQGESRQAGRPCVFVRLTECNLRCTWCDTPYAFEQGEEMTHGAILDRVARFGTRYVLITGGEPLLQPQVHGLIAELLDRGYEVGIETGGSLDISPVDPRATIIMDLKCPGSGMQENNLWDNVERLKPTDEVKFVLADRDDYEWARAIMAQHRLPERCAVLLSPVHGKLSPRALAEWMLSDALGARLQMQIHKYIWPAGTRGV